MLVKHKPHTTSPAPVTVKDEPVPQAHPQQPSVAPRAVDIITSTSLPTPVTAPVVRDPRLGKSMVDVLAEPPVSSTAAVERADAVKGSGSLVAADIHALSGLLTDADVSRLETVLSFLSSAQLEWLAAHTDLVEKSDRFLALLDTTRAVDQAFENYDRHGERVKVRLSVEDWAAKGSLTAASAARVLAILLTGYVSERMAPNITLDNLDLTKLAGLQRQLTQTSLVGLRNLYAHLMSMPLPRRESFVRAMGWELARNDQELVVRLVEQLGVAQAKQLLPELAAFPDDVKAVAAEISRQDKVDGYLSLQRVPDPVPVYAPSATTVQLVEKARTAIQAADVYATEHKVNLASPPAQLAQARELYGQAAKAIQAVVTSDKMAIQDEVVKGWMQRRSRALFIHGAVEDVLSGATQGLVARLLNPPPPGPSLVRPGGRSDLRFLGALTESLGFPPRYDTTPAQQSQIVQELVKRLLLDAKVDPLVDVMMPPVSPVLSHVHVVFAPGVIPIAGVLEEAIKHLKETYGVDTVVARTGLFQSEDFNAAAVREAYESVLKKDPQARVVFIGYSQGAVNTLTFLDQMRSGSPEDREASKHAAAVISLYGAHNGSPSADDGITYVKTLMESVPGGKRLEYLLTGIGAVGRWVAGGVDSLKRSTREKFWLIANLPADIPYMSIGARSTAEEVPLVLKQAHQVLKTAAESRGLPPDNDTQVLFCDAPMGNDWSEMGKAVRKNNVHLEVHGHHWNTLSPRLVNWDPEPSRYVLPKTPQVEAHLLTLAEIGAL